jgi:hypothetical protein
MGGNEEKGQGVKGEEKRSPASVLASPIRIGLILHPAAQGVGLWRTNQPAPPAFRRHDTIRVAEGATQGRRKVSSR